MKQKWKIVSIKDCIKTLIIALILFAGVAFIPYSMGGEKSFFLLGVFPFSPNPVTAIADGQAKIIELLPTLEETISLIFPIINYVPIIYFSILALDVFFALLLLFFRVKALRILFKVISIILGVATIFCSLLLLICTLSGVIALSFGSLSVGFIESGLLSLILATLFSFFLIPKQFSWFSKPYRFEIKNKNV